MICISQRSTRHKSSPTKSSRRARIRSPAVTHSKPGCRKDAHDAEIIESAKNRSSGRIEEIRTFGDGLTCRAGWILR